MGTGISYVSPEKMRFGFPGLPITNKEMEMGVIFEHR